MNAHFAIRRRGSIKTAFKPANNVTYARIAANGTPQRQKPKPIPIIPVFNVVTPLIKKNFALLFALRVITKHPCNEKTQKESIIVNIAAFL